VEAGDLQSVSPWLAGIRDRRDALEGEHDADVVIVGAGLTGLSTALALRRDGLDTVVLEAQTSGFGASGRNAGHLTPTIGKDLFTLTRMYGHERVQALVALQELAISHVEALLRRHSIDCRYEPVGNVVAAVHEKQHRNIDRAAAAAAAHGVPGELLDADALERRGLPRAFTRGFFEPHGGVLNPGLYVRGLLTAALGAGAAVYDDSPVVAVEDAPSPVAITPRGRVRARLLVLATNAYTPALPTARHLRRAGMRLQVQLFASAPLTDEQLARVGWRGREGIYTAHEALESYRLSAGNRIVGGSKWVRAGFGDRELDDVDARIAARLEQVFHARFPELADVAVDRHWGGPIFLPLDFLPRLGRGGRHGNMIHSLGYAGHGVALASYAGEMIADLIQDRDGPGAALWSRRALPTPPEPLRWIVYRGIKSALEWLDRRVDRRARGRPRPGC
jgi:glycine/D-amino acid oxidase-like deaminating enzyme